MKYFKHKEFDSPDELGSGYKMDRRFLEMIDNTRGLAGVPFKINSGYRTYAHNRKIGGKYNSSHLRGYAADISCKYSRNRYKIINAALKSGFKRIGIANTFIHLDNDPNKTSHVIWTY